MEILEGIFVKKDQKKTRKKSHICKYMRDHNFVQISTKMRISSLRNRNLVQIGTKMRIKICIIQKNVVPLQRIFKMDRYELHQTGDLS